MGGKELLFVRNIFHATMPFFSHAMTIATSHPILFLVGRLLPNPTNDTLIYLVGINCCQIIIDKI